MDRLAAEGLRYNHFHTTALCSLTRATLIMGRNHHSATFAGITELATGYDGYTCILPRSCGTIGEILRQNGYRTAWIDIGRDVRSSVDFTYNVPFEFTAKVEKVTIELKAEAAKEVVGVAA
jgi:hypothetical protein